MPNRDSSSSNPRTFGWFRAATARGGFFAPRGSSSRTPAPFGPVRRRLTRRSLSTQLDRQPNFRSPVDDFLIAFTVRYSSMQVGLDQSREVLHSTHFVDTRFHARARERGRVDTGKRKSARPVGTFVCFLDVVGLGTTRAWVINQSINQSFGLELAVVNRRIETPSVNRRRR